MSKQRNWFAIWVTTAVVAVIAVIAAIVVIGNNNATSAGDPPKSSIVNGDTGAITFGTGEHKLDTYVDFMCPACGKFEDSYGPDVRKKVDEGKLTLNLHPIAILDRASGGTQFSTRAASAMYCVAENDPSAAMDYLQMLYLNQPKEGSSGLTNDDLVRFAQQSNAKNSDSCIASAKYSKYVTALTKKTPVADGQKSISTPTIVLDGSFITLTGDVNGDLISKIG